MTAINYTVPGGDTVHQGLQKLEARAQALEDSLGNNGLPVMSFAGDVSKSEGNTGVTSYSFTLLVQRNGNSQSLPFVWAVVGTGSNPASAADFVGGVLPSGSGTFASGETSKTIVVNVQTDSLIEPDEQFTISASATANIVGATAVGTIVNDDVVDPLDFTLPKLTITAYDQINGDIGHFISNDNDTTTYTITSDVNNFFEISKSKLRYKGPPGAIGTTYPITIHKTKAGSSSPLDKSFTITVTDLDPWNDPNCVMWIDAQSGVTKDGSNKVSAVANRAAAGGSVIFSRDIPYTSNGTNQLTYTGTGTPGGIGIVAGMGVSGPGITSGTTITNVAGTILTLSSTVSGSGAITVTVNLNPIWVDAQANGKPWLNFSNGAYGLADSTLKAALQSALFNTDKQPWTVVAICRPSALNTIKTVVGITATLPTLGNLALSVRQASTNSWWEVARGDKDHAGGSVSTQTIPSVVAAAGDLQVLIVRSDGYRLDINQNGAGGQAQTDPPILNSTHVGGSFTINEVQIGAGNGAFKFADPIAGLGIFKEVMDPDAITRWVHDQMLITSRLDLGGVMPMDNLTLIYNSDYEDQNNYYSPVFANDYQLGGVQDVIPRLEAVASSNMYMTTPATPGETCDFVDPRSAAMLPYNPFSFPKDSILRMTASVKTADPNLSIPPFNTRPYMAGAMVSLNYDDVNIQYGYWVAKVKMPKTGPGAYSAFWLMGTDGGNYPEIDIFEQFGDSMTLHQHILAIMRPTAGQMNEEFATFPVKSMSTSFNEIGVLKTPDGLFGVFNGRLTGKSIMNGIYGPAATITNGGSGYTSAPTVTVSVTVRPGGTAPTFTAVVAGGVVTAVNVNKPGSRLTGPVTLTITGGGGAGATATASVATDDPKMHSILENTTHYFINEVSAGFLGNTTADQLPLYYDTDYIKIYKWKPTFPAIGAGTDSDAQAYFDKCNTTGTAVSDPRKVLVNNLVKQLKNTAFRFDTKPMSGFTLDWDPTKVTAWDSFRLLGLLCAETEAHMLIDLRDPTHLYTKRGSPVHTPSKGVQFSSTIGEYIDLNYAVDGDNLIRAADCGLGIYINNAPTAAQNLGIMGAGGSLNITMGTGSMAYVSSAAAPVGPVFANNGGPRPKPLGGKGYWCVTRGFQSAGHIFKDGKEKWSGLFAGNPQTALTGELTLGAISPSTAGAAFSAALVHAGRRHTFTETDKINEIFTEFLTGVGAL